MSGSTSRWAGTHSRSVTVSSFTRRLRSGGFPWRAPDWPTSIERPLPEREVGVDYDTDWARRYPVRLARAVVIDNVTRPLAHLVATPRVQGEELFSLVEPPVILVANHTSHVDTPLLISLLPARIRHATIVAGAADYFFDRRWKAHMWAFLTAAIPIERQRVNRKSADLAADLIDDGWSLLIYPEGGRSPDGWMQEFRGGAAYLAVRTGRPVVPVHLEGTGRVLPRHRGKLQRAQTTVTFGMPIHPEPGEHARALGRRIEQAVHLLASEQATDWWTARRLAAQGEPTAAKGPDASAWRRAWALGPDPESHSDGDWAIERPDK
ncbi:MAG: lysophospholipid acyltransferase family protein [Acidimicrobiales bacterium]